MRQLLYFAIAALMIGAFVPKMYGSGTPGMTTPARADVSQAAPASSRKVTISASANGHFETAVSVDGRSADFMVDTGASMIALRERDAGKLGIFPMPADYTALVATANGKVKAARVQLKKVDVGGVTVRDVAALVLPDDALGQNLLGMSFLSQLRWEQKNGKLILEQ